jgi:hypothetical protein
MNTCIVIVENCNRKRQDYYRNMSSLPNLFSLLVRVLCGNSVIGGPLSARYLRTDTTRKPMWS